jgi:low temperature requirement protein LtrA
MNRKQWLILLGVAMIALTIVPVFAFEKRLEHTGGPGILAFEFAATKAQILAEWGPKGRDIARASLFVDYAYMVSYGGFFTLAGLATRDLARTRDWRRLVAAGTIVPFLATIAAIFDATENVFLLLVLEGHVGESAALIATICSSLKVTLITIAILYVLCGLVWRAATATRVKLAST